TSTLETTKDRPTWPWCRHAPILLAVVAGFCLPDQAFGGPVSFRNEVMAVLSKGGCNQGACHGNQNGKNGFKLSLRGEDPAFDYAALTRDMLGRRINALRPAESLLLLKATAAIAHEGGKRFGGDSLEYALLARWLAEGARPDTPDTPIVKQVRVTPTEQIIVEPSERVQLHVQARFSNGTARDITRLATYELSN